MLKKCAQKTAFFYCVLLSMPGSDSISPRVETSPHSSDSETFSDCSESPEKKVDTVLVSMPKNDVRNISTKVLELDNCSRRTFTF